MRRLKLANIILDPGDFLGNAPELFYREGGTGSCRFSCSHHRLSVNGKVDFCTYFNILPVSAWKKYGSVRSGRLHLDAAGDEFTLNLKAYFQRGDRVVSDVVKTMSFDGSEVSKACEMDVPFGDYLAVGFEVHTSGNVQIGNASYYALVDENRLHPVNLNICLANRPSDRSVVPNLKSMFAFANATEESIAGRAHFTVIDNEGDLRKAMDSMENLPELLDLSVVEARDRGRAGSMAVAMRSSMEEPGRFTHMVFIDSDTRVHPESLRRMYTLLALLAPEYALSTISGAYFRLDKPYRQLGDVRRTSVLGNSAFVKKPHDVSSAFKLVMSGTVSVELPGVYAPWNFVCMPVALFREHGLPLPLHVRCEDLEYGMRSDPLCVTMPGIGSWDADAFSRHADEISCYQYPRNMLIANAVNHCFNETLFMFLYWRRFRILLRYLNYEAAELWLDALEDYLKGPGFLSRLDGAEKLSGNKARTEKLLELWELPNSAVDVEKLNKSWLHASESTNPVRRAFESIPHDSHYLPEFLLLQKPGLVGTQGNSIPWVKTCFRKKLIVLGEFGDMGGMRVMDKSRFKALNRRASELKMRFADSKMAVALQYQDEFRSLSSAKQWE